MYHVSPSTSHKNSIFLEGHLETAKTLEKTPIPSERFDTNANQHSWKTQNDQLLSSIIDYDHVIKHN